MDFHDKFRDYLDKGDVRGLNNLLSSLEDVDENDLVSFISQLELKLESSSQDSFDETQVFLRLLIPLTVRLYQIHPTHGLKYLAPTLKRLFELGKRYFVESNYFLAEQVFTNIYELNVSLDLDIYKKHASKYMIFSQLGYFSDLARAANMYRYFGDIDRGIGLAWRALVLSLDIIVRTLEFGHDIVAIVREIKSHFFVCRNVLLEIKDDTRPVVKLKLDELYEAYELLSDEIPDTPEEIRLWVETHRESLQYLIPQEPPSILVLTEDGRVIHYAKMTSELDRNVEPFAHLVGGVLTAINSIFVEEYRRLGGAIREIITAEKIIYISNRKTVNVAVFCDFLTDALIKFSESLADELEERSRTLLLNWRGDEGTIRPLKNFINDQIKAMISA
ncbi:MAG: hypothetical protein D6732_15615 [Methanobacteriota archaeon]|nr:MAG: hypothetical protein D6732_15615 [Euryarchaeota archaeon]